jgi:pseudouridine-5'-phosphate glycosidase
VHRGAPASFDISADLLELARTPVAVVCAGAKAILDLPLTLEVLETHGVPVIGWQTDELPAFYTRESGLTLEHEATEIGELAAICRVRWDDLAQGGVLVANPIPAAAALDVEVIDEVIAEALMAAEAAGATGKRLTPFLLARIAEATGGAAVAANRALALANAEVGAALAVALAAGAPPR